MITSGDNAMKRYLNWIVAANLFLAAGNLHAAVEVEVPGLLTDHTVSSIGHDFYRAFSDKWESEYTGNLTINERPSARWGSWITITINQDVIFQTFLFPILNLPHQFHPLTPLVLKLFLHMLLFLRSCVE